MTAIENTIYEQPQPELDCPILENPTTETPLSENPIQLNKELSITKKSNMDLSSTHSIPIHSPNFLPLEDGYAIRRSCRYALLAF
jgi:hypothetical protein